MLDLDWDETAHPRAAVGTTGKYHGGEFVPKEQAPAPPARRPLNERDMGIAAEYLGDKTGILEERGDEPESSLHILRRAFLAAMNSPEALEALLEIPAVRENKHIAEMLKLLDSMNPNNPESPQGVRDRFGLRAIHFGGSVTVSEKQAQLGALTGALSLLSGATGLPEGKLGFSNNLGFMVATALGPGVKAAYLPDSRAIEMDSRNGESLAHEWFHALDDALGRQAMGGNYKQLATRTGYAMWNTEASPEVFDALANVMRCIYSDCPQWREASQEMDKRQFKDGTEYWASMHEMCARGFAAYVKDKSDFMPGPWNTYLLGDKSDYMRLGPDAGMVPPDSEMKGLRAKFDALFAALAAHPALLKALFDKESHPRADKGSKDPKHKGGQFVPKGTGSKAEDGQGSFDFDADDADLDNTLSDLEEHGETGHLKAQEDPEAASAPQDGGQEGGEDKPRLNRPLTDDETHAAAHLFGQARNEVEESGDHEGGSWMQAHNGLEAAKQGPAALEQHLAAAGDEDPHAAAVKAHLGLRAGSQAEKPEPASAERDYRENGIRAAGFKQWFGDWENEPAKASKVVNKAGEPEETHSLPDGAKLVFHGTSHGGFKEWDPSRLNHNGLYGGGFYFTEDENVAKDYTDKDKTYKLSRALTEKDMPKAEKWLGSTGYDEMRTDLGIQRSWKSAVQAFKEGPEAFQQWLESDNNRGGIQSGILKKLKIEQADAGEAQVYSCYLNIRQPLDVDAPVSMADLKTFWSGLAADHPNNKAMEDTDTYQYLTGAMKQRSVGQSSDAPYQPTWADLFSDAADSTSPQFRGEQWKSIYPALKGMGFDGITHIGGGRYNANDGHRHRVWIAFQPEQIKAADNAGTFDPKNPDMFKGLPHDVSQQARDKDGKWTAGASGQSEGETLEDSFGVKVTLPDDADPGTVAYHLEHINAGFHDLASVLDLAPAEIGFAGALSVTLADKLSKSGNMAEFDMANRSLTLGMQSGSGSLAHEWWHAFDNALARNRFPGKGDDWYLSENLPEGELGDGMEDILNAIHGSLFDSYASSHDTGQDEKYWSQPIELTARAFEAYVENKLAARGRENRYLVDTDATTNGDRESFYPTEDEDTEPIFAAFDRFMGAVKKNRNLLKSLRLLLGVEV